MFIGYSRIFYSVRKVTNNNCTVLFQLKKYKNLQVGIADRMRDYAYEDDEEQGTIKTIGRNKRK